MEIKLIKKSDSPYGLDALASLSYSAAAASSLNADEKRKLIFSLYSLRCLFDNIDLIDPPDLLLRHGCSFLFAPKAHPQYAQHADFFASALLQNDAVSVPGGGLLISRHGEKKLKFDAGSPLFSHFVSVGQIPAEFAEYPTKFGIFQAILLLLGQKSASNELRSLWFLLFPFLLDGAPDEDGLIVKIAQKLNNEDVYHAAFFGDYAGIVPADPAEAFVNQSFAAGWFLGYDNWRAQQIAPPVKVYSAPPYFDKSSGEVSTDGDDCECNAGCGTGRAADKNGNVSKSAFLTDGAADGYLKIDEDKAAENAQILLDAEQLFAKNPESEDALLLLLAARTNQPPQNQTRAQLMQNIKLISHYLPVHKSKQVLAYYLGLSFLGLRQFEKAIKALKLCLKIKPDYAPALEMLKALSGENTTIFD